MEYGWIRTWLDWIFSLPWATRSEENFDLKKAREVLDQEYSGLEDVKERIIESLAVKKLREKRKVVDEKGREEGL